MFCACGDIYTPEWKNDKTTGELPHASVRVLGSNVSIIECIIHDARSGLGHYGDAPVGAYIYGNLFFNSGYMSAQQGNDYPGFGQNLYGQNAGPPSIRIINNWLMGSTDEYSWQFQGTANAATKGCDFIENFVQEGTALFGYGADVEDVNILRNTFYNSLLRVIPNSASLTSRNVFIDQNYSYHQQLHRDYTAEKHRSIGDFANTNPAANVGRGDFTINRNTIIRDRTLYPGDGGNINQNQEIMYFTEVSDADIYGENNTFIGLDFELNGSRVGLSAVQAYLDGPGNTHSGTIPTSNVVFVRKSEETPGRAHVHIVNHENVTSQAVDFSSFLSVGQSWSAYWPWDIQQGLDATTVIVEPVAVQTGTYEGGTVVLDWSGQGSEGMESITNGEVYRVPFWRRDRIAGFIVIGE
jgi:hypothetical protein